MGLTLKRTRAAKLANNVRHQHSDSNDENTPPGDPKSIPDAPLPLGHKSKTLRSQIIEKDSRIMELEAIISGLETELSHVRSDLNHVCADHEILCQQLQSQLRDKQDTLAAVQQELSNTITLQTCAEVFGIAIIGTFMTQRTVAHVRDEGGKYRFIESSDGTTHRGMNFEARHITLRAPLYASGVNDADRSTWTPQTRVIEVAPALDHTAERQFESSMEAAACIADMYSRSPLALEGQRTMEVDDYYRKKDGEMKDHAANGKKEFHISDSYKETVVLRDLGHTALEDGSVPLSRILQTIPEVTDVDITTAGRIPKSDLESLSPDQRAQLASLAILRKIGKEQFDALPSSDQEDLLLHLFGGCCSHKDLNVSIESGTAAAQATAEASTRGAIKLLQLIGSLLRHQDGKRGYQDKCVLFMKERKLELYSLDEPGKFPDVSNQFGAYTYAAVEVVCFHGLIYELVEEVIDGKTKSGQPNHVEKNILKGLGCTSTFTELVALALYGVSVSWLYMALVHGKKNKPVNLLSLTDLHRKLPLFCSHVAANPDILLDPETPLNKFTIDSLAFRDDLLLPTILSLCSSLPHLSLIITVMFNGAAEGWVHFTLEFHVDGPFDRLSPAQKARIFIPSTNDHNEGLLSSFRVHMWQHPNTTAASFSNQMRAEHNNTESFIQKHVNSPALLRFAMREVWRDGASRRRAKLQKLFLALQREKAQKALRHRTETATKKKLAYKRLQATEVEFDVDKINSMTLVLLKAQLQVYRDKLNDPVLQKMKWKDMQTVDLCRRLVLAAQNREFAKRETSDKEAQAVPDLLQMTEGLSIDEFGYAADEDDGWEEEHFFSINRAASTYRTDGTCKNIRLGD
ncbi:hypothetical protein DFH08DRAFT_806298 [Mycena albidolilacea]|uniref:Uncharacterized protein n=1 Tax=Mycena albidolilacea TaxID=1033008 RepID=A0AAD7A845_9AGAR|nr:hypothetical protein DFH08DRAFT_806298 [Mycena albidolilacea]